jgi:hypothetical protein
MYSSDFIYLSHPFSSLPSLYKKLTKRPNFFSCIWLPMCASFPTLSQQFFKGRLTFPYGYHTFISSATFHINIEMFKLSISQIFLSCPRSNVGQISHSFMEKFARPLLEDRSSKAATVENLRVRSSHARWLLKRNAEIPQEEKDREFA